VEYLAKITWLGHAAFKIEIAGKTVLVDPWLDGNPTSPVKASDVTMADIVYVTHDHSDHLGNAFDICSRTGADFVSVAELAEYAHETGIKNVVGLNVGGSTEIKGVTVTVVQAIHAASRGAPTGVMLEGEGKTIYHAGDTRLFDDMRLIGEAYRPDVVMIPIGGYYTMDAIEAVEAVKLINPKTVIPMHYKTLKVLAQSADEFVNKMKEAKSDARVIVLKPGESYEL